MERHAEDEMGIENAVFEVRLERLVYGGEALGRLPDGRALFAAFGLPGELVRVRVVEEHPRHVRAELLEVLEPAPERIAARCRHFGVCGGCHYQHLRYEDQLRAKQAILKDQLERIGHFTDPPVRPIVPSTNPWNYRNTMQFHLDAQGKLGFQRANSHTVVAIEECHLPEEELNELWPLLEMEPVPGLERVTVRQGDETLLALESSGGALPTFQVDMPLSAVWLGPEGGDPIVLAGDDFTRFEVLGRTFTVSAGAFFQVNTAQAEALVKHVVERAALGAGDTVLDVYCGVGLFSAFLAPKAGRLVGVELSPQACADFAMNLDEFEHVELYEGAAEEVLPKLNVKPRGIVVDPPRAGLERAALDAIVGMGPEWILYVSCDPATLARDLARMVKSGYSLREVTPFDLFPQTYHLEAVAWLTKNSI